MFETIEEESLFCFYDSIKKLAILTFSNTIQASHVASASEWLAKCLAEKSQTPVQGILINLKDAKKFDIQHFTELDIVQGKPIVFIVSNTYQEHVLKKQVQCPECSQVVYTYTDAFAFLYAGTLANDNVETLAVLDTDGASAYYDLENHLMRVVYYGPVTAKSTADVYGTINGTFVENGVSDVLGAVFDFRYVTNFENSNLTTVRNTSTHLNTNYDMNHIAVALIVGNLIQEKMVLVALKVTPQEERKRIVHSYDEAHQFIREFHAKRKMVDK